jgi:hypothetical protein
MLNEFSKGTTVSFAVRVPSFDEQPHPPKELDAAVYRHGCDPPLR